MRAEWLQDLLALLECGSVQAAAERRSRTQPAFSRRIKAIEEHLGMELLDRTRKPAQLKPSVVEQKLFMQELAFGLQSLEQRLRRDQTERETRVVVICQHSITTALMPQLVKRLASLDALSLRVRSDNHDECFAMLMTRRADICLLYRSVMAPLPAGEDVREEVVLSDEELIPVYQTSSLDRLNEDYARGSVPVVAYPMDVFLGRIMMRDIYPRLVGATHIKTVAETALTPAALQFAVAGVGVAWLPRALVRHDIEIGRLTDLSGSLPSSALSLVAMRWRNERRPIASTVWETILSVDEMAPAVLA